MILFYHFLKINIGVITFRQDHPYFLNLKLKEIIKCPPPKKLYFGNFITYNYQQDLHFVSISLGEGSVLTLSDAVKVAKTRMKNLHAISKLNPVTPNQSPVVKNARSRSANSMCSRVGHGIDHQNSDHYVSIMSLFYQESFKTLTTRKDLII